MQNATVSISWGRQKVKFETAKKEEINFSSNMASRAYKTLPSAFRKDSSNGAVKRVSSDSHRYVRLFVYYLLEYFVICQIHCILFCHLKVIKNQVLMYLLTYMTCNNINASWIGFYFGKIEWGRSCQKILPWFFTSKS
jgi:hypothetical protein